MRELSLCIKRIFYRDGGRSAVANGAGGKKRGGRRAYLNDFKVGSDGEYSYKGVVCRYTGKLPYNKVKLRVGVLAGLAVLCMAAAGLIPASSMLGMGNFYVVPFFMAQLVAVFITAWGAVRLLLNGAELREYVFKATVKRIPGGAMAAFITALCSLAANVVHVCINGFGANPVWLALLMLLHAVTACAAYLLYKLIGSLTWDLAHKDTEAEAFSEAFDFETDASADK